MEERGAWFDDVSILRSEAGGGQRRVKAWNLEVLVNGT